MTKKNVVVGITGASGAAYAMRLLEVLMAGGCDVHVSISQPAQAVLKTARIVRAPEPASEEMDR